jgi:general secretion pathway protein G
MKMADGRLRIAELKARRRNLPSVNPSSVIRHPRSNGFTLLELMIVISIIIVLAVIVLPQYQRTVQTARESVLRDDLFQMRRMLDQYAADKGKLPDSLEELSQAGYMREMPVDPMTGQRDWVPQSGQDANSAEGGSGVIDVHSASSDQALDGSTYSEW